MDKNNQLQQLKDDFDELKKRFEDELKKSQKENDKLKADIKLLQERRIGQTQFLPGAVRMRTMGEANKYIYAGLEADLPDGESVTSSVLAYFATDTDTLYIWNGTAFVSTTLT